MTYSPITQNIQKQIQHNGNNPYLKSQNKSIKKTEHGANDYSADLLK